MHEELIQRLTRTANYLAEEEWTEAATAIRDAIQALTAPQAETCERDAVMWLVWSNEHNAWWRANRAGYTNKLVMAGRYSFDNAFSICRNGGNQRAGSDKDWPYEVMVPAPETNKRPWTRKDGSTTPRGDVVDRRKSEYGNYREAPGSIPRRCQIPERDFYGRRSGDRARWTAPVQGTPQTLVQWFEETYRHIIRVDNLATVGMVRDLLRELDRRSAMK